MLSAPLRKTKSRIIGLGSVPPPPPLPFSAAWSSLAAMAASNRRRRPRPPPPPPSARSSSRAPSPRPHSRYRARSTRACSAIAKVAKQQLAAAAPEADSDALSGARGDGRAVSLHRALRELVTTATSLHQGAPPPSRRRLSGRRPCCRLPAPRPSRLVVVPARTAGVRRRRWRRVAERRVQPRECSLWRDQVVP